jgi:hypothetical protein
MHGEVGPNGMVGLALLRKTGKLPSLNTSGLICLRADTESAAHYRQEASHGLPASFDSLSLFSHQTRNGSHILRASC